MQDVWAETFQLRFGLSETVARPDLREISASTYIDPLTETRIRGNPDLVTSAIENFDVRAEWFFSNGDNFTVSLFYKDIENPIETVQGAGTDDNISLTFINAQSADVTGVEVEWLKDLSTFGVAFFEPFFFSGNVTLSDSELTVGNVGFNVTNDVRRMSQHSEYVANLQLGFDSDNGAHGFTVAYNTFGERLFFAGRDGIPDAFEQPFDSLDFIYTYYPTDRLSLKFRIAEPARRAAGDRASRHNGDRAERRCLGKDRRQVGSGSVASGRAAPRAERRPWRLLDPAHRRRRLWQLRRHHRGGGERLGFRQWITVRDPLGDLHF